MRYGKIFSKFSEDSIIDLYYRFYDINKESYVDVIEAAQKEGLNQVIINSEIMFELMDYTVNLGGIVNRIIFNEGADSELVDNINRLVSTLKGDKAISQKLKTLIGWALDKGSIDIARLYITLKCENSTFFQGEILSNGIVISDKAEELFDLHLKKVIGEYLNGDF